jgi:2-polyprenyl-3-methyl-5-hydroxy-6-metoxy-1,4-benzoquinol methylase
MSDDPRPTSELDPEAVGLFAFNVWNYKQGEMVSLMIHLGQRLDLYRSMAGIGPVSSRELAERTGLDERWVREWLHGQAAAGLLDHDPDRGFELTDVGAAVLADDETSLFYAAGAFTAPPPAPEVVDGMVESFRSGIGLTYDDRGPSAAHQTEQSLGPWVRLALLPTILPALEGVEERLDAGGVVADVGCGAGVAVLTMAGRYREARFHGYDSSRHAIGRARANLDAADLNHDRTGDARVAFHLVDGAALPTEPTFDLVITFDVLHDLVDPAGVAAAIRAAIKDDGTWLIKDIRCADTFEANRKNPMLAMMYGFSIEGCLASATSEPGGAGYGTLGLPPSAMEALCRAAGFTRFRVHDFEDPANLYYEVRP